MKWTDYSGPVLLFLTGSALLILGVLRAFDRMAEDRPRDAPTVLLQVPANYNPPPPND